MFPIDYADPFRLSLEWNKTVPIVRSPISIFIMASYTSMIVLSIHQLLNNKKTPRALLEQAGVLSFVCIVSTSTCHFKITK